MNVGVMGHGPIVESCLDAISKVDGAKAIATYNRPNSSKEGERLAKEFNIPKTYTDFDAFLQDKDIDTIYIALPNGLHYEFALKVLEAGKNAIVEKPFTSTIEEANHLVEVAKEKRLFLFEAITTYHNPNVKALKERLGDIGDLALVQTNYSQYSSRYDLLLNGEWPNIFNPKFSGGALMDINIYNIHFLVTLFGEPENITYYPRLYENKIDTSGIAILQYPNLPCSAIGAKDSASEGYAYIQGKLGTLIVNGPVNESSSVTIKIGKTEETINLQPHDNRLVYEMENFTRVIKEKDYSTCEEWLNHTCSVVRTVEKARKSAGITFSADTK